MKKMLVVILLGLSMPVLAADSIRLLPYSSGEFQPAQGQEFSIPLALDIASKVRIDIFTPDGDKIRELVSEEVLAPGEHEVIWDGKDRDGVIVPDEAYYPVAHIISDAGVVQSTFDRGKTGGEVIDDLNVEISSKENISFRLPMPSRVLTRAGIKGGPMLRTLFGWTPKNKGKVVIRWDGFDADHLTDLRSNSNVSILVRAYSLPEFSIITSGNDALFYRDYRQKEEARQESEDENRPLERDGKRIERHYYEPKSNNLSPEVMLEWVDNYPRNENDIPILSCPCPVRVDMDKQEKAQLQNSLYEIAFFVNNEFVSEQEQGYVPFSWRWTPNDLKPGEHILTVNVSGLRGEVGVKSLKFILPERVP